MTARFRSKNIAKSFGVGVAAAIVLAMSSPWVANAQVGRPQAAPVAATVSVPTPPPDYTIGPDDLLSIVFWRDKDMSADVAVRPDGMISLPLLNDVQASGMTPSQLKDSISELSKKFVEDPNVTVV